MSAVGLTPIEKYIQAGGWADPITRTSILMYSSYNHEDSSDHICSNWLSCPSRSGLEILRNVGLNSPNQRHWSTLLYSSLRVQPDSIVD